MSDYRHWQGFVLPGAQDEQGPVVTRVVCPRACSTTIATVRRRPDDGSLVLLTLSRRAIEAGFVRKYTRFDVWDLWPLAIADPCQTRCPKHGWIDLTEEALERLNAAAAQRTGVVIP